MVPSAVRAPSTTLSNVDTITLIENFHAIDTFDPGEAFEAIIIFEEDAFDLILELIIEVIVEVVIEVIIEVAIIIEVIIVIIFETIAIEEAFSDAPV